MKLTIDAKRKILVQEVDGAKRELPLYSQAAFELLSDLWLKVGWDQKYVYSFSWLGRPIIQLPEDMIRVQEVIYRVKPDVIIETGIAHGGSLIYYASLCQLVGMGRVIGIDIEIRPVNRAAIESHDLAPLITLIEGSSTDVTVVDQVRALVGPGETVMVLLDSCHTKQHVAAELEAYHGFVSAGSYVVVTDGIMKDLHDVPRGDPEWAWNNPSAAASEFVQDHPEFVLEEPPWPFNESNLTNNVTHWPGAWLRRT